MKTPNLLAILATATFLVACNQNTTETAPTEAPPPAEAPPPEPPPAEAPPPAPTP